MQAASGKNPNCNAQATYFSHLAEGRFMIQQCEHCNKHVFYPRVFCVHCGSERLHWVQPSGKGVVYSTSIVRKKKEDGGDYNVVLIDLEENVRLMSRVEEISLDRIAIGMAVQAKVVLRDGEPVLVFVPTGEPS